MTKQHEPPKQAGGTPVERPVRPLVQRLRHEAMHTGYKPTKWDLLMEAADELERLRADRDSWAQQAADRAQDALDLVAAERERCAKLCDDARAAIWDYHDKQVRDTAETVCINLAARIRGA